MRYWIAPLAFLALASCATLSEDTCREGDWQSIGFNDGSNGRSASHIENHAEACAPYGIAPEPAPWERGRQAGLKLYCTPERAYDTGVDGRRLRPVCPAADVRALERANRRGLTFHRITEEIEDVKADIRRIDAELASLPSDDPARSVLLSERSSLRFDLLGLRTERALYRF